MRNNSEPPVGVMPRNIWEEKRRLELYNAIARYLIDGYSIPVEWVEEYNEINNRKEVE